MTLSDVSVDLAPTEGVRLWSLRLDDRVPESARAASILSPEERERASKILDPRRRARFVRVRVAVRELLGAALGEPPASVPIRHGHAGKPYLDGSPVCFSVSHARDVALIGITRAGPVGVDVQGPRPGHDLLRIANRFFHESEAEAIAALPPGAAADAFLRAWTAKEAVVKALGIGIWGSTSRVVVDLEPGGKLRLLAVPGTVPAERWSLIEAPVPAGGRAAAAIPREGVELTAGRVHRLDRRPGAESRPRA